MEFGFWDACPGPEAGLSDQPAVAVKVHFLIPCAVLNTPFILFLPAERLD